MLVHSASCIYTHTNINDAMIINESGYNTFLLKQKRFLAIYNRLNHFPNSTSSRIYRIPLFSVQFFCRFLLMVGCCCFAISSFN